MDEWLATLSAWLVGLAKSAFEALLTWIHDAALWVFDGVLSAFGTLIASIPVPSFLSSGLNIGTLLSGMPPYTLYVLQQINITACFAVIGAGVAFRLLRKFTTLFQW